jgi:hypothetical protein
MLKSDSEIGLVVLGLTPPYLEPSSHEALHEIDLGMLKSKEEIRRLTDGQGVYSAIECLAPRSHSTAVSNRHVPGVPSL